MKNLIKTIAVLAVLWFFYQAAHHYGTTQALINQAQAGQQSVSSNEEVTPTATSADANGDRAWEEFRADLRRRASATATDTAVEKASQTSATAPPPVTKPIAANSEMGYKIGEQFKLGNYTYKVTKVALASRLGNQFINAVAGEDEKFVVVYFLIRNDTKKTQAVLADDFQINDAQGRQFSTDSEASTALLVSGASKDFLVRQIQPSLTKKAVTVFRVPADTPKDHMTLVVPEKGFFSTGKVTVTLN